MSQERKVSVLRALLDRVQKRAAGPRAVAAAQTDPLTSISGAPSVPAVSAAFPVAAPLTPSPAPPAVSAVLGTPPASSAVRAPLPSTPFDLTAGRAPSHSAPSSVSDDRRDEREHVPPVDSVPPPSISQEDEDEGPPSAPRLREIPEQAAASDAELDEQELEEDEEEAQLKTPPPESGRQHVAAGPSAIASEADEDISITVTMEESEMPPTVESEPPPEITTAAISSRPDLSDLNAPLQRLALVSEPEIELHGMTPLSAVAEPIMPAKPLAAASVGPAAASNRHDDIELAVSVSASARSVPPASPPDFSTAVTTPPTGVTPSAAPQSIVTAPPVAVRSAATAPPAAHLAVTAAPAPLVTAPPVAVQPPASPPVRIMAQPLQTAPAQPQAPVEVWASLHAPASLHGRVATFVGQNAKFDPKTFGEVVMASIALGDDDS